MEETMPQSQKSRIHRLNLKELGVRLGKIDHHLIALLNKRADLARQVEEWKTIEAQNDPLIREKIEEERLGQIAEWAKEAGMNPNFARLMLYSIIGESCKTQIKQKQGRILGVDEDAPYKGTEPEWYAFLKKNLLMLTMAIAPTYDKEYGEAAPFATSIYVRHEEKTLLHEINTLKALVNTGTALDLGCATGRMSFLMASHFENVVGYDISPAMIGIAYGKMAELDVNNISFAVRDVETEVLPLPNESVSCAIMNLGTASDIPQDRMQIVVREIKRVLNKGGRFLLSFYNSAALFNHLFLPWPTDILAEINPTRNCLNVHFKERIFRIYARSYTIREARQMIEKCGLKISSIVTYPTIASILPKEFFLDFQSEDVCREIEAIDKKFAGIKTGGAEIDADIEEGHVPAHGKGAYILITGGKNSD